MNIRASSFLLAAGLILVSIASALPAQTPAEPEVSADEFPRIPATEPRAAGTDC